MESSDGFNINPSKTVASWWQEVQAGVDLLIIMMTVLMILWYRLSKVFIFILDWNPTRWSGGLTGLSTLWWNCYQDAKANRNVFTAVGLFVVGGGIGLGCEASLMRIIPHQSVQVPPICPFNTWSPPQDSAQIFGECTQPPGKWENTSLYPESWCNFSYYCELPNLKLKDGFYFLTGSQQLLLSTKSPKPGVSTFHNLMMMMNLVMVKVMMMMIIGPWNDLGTCARAIKVAPDVSSKHTDGSWTMMDCKSSGQSWGGRMIIIAIKRGVGGVIQIITI